MRPFISALGQNSSPDTKYQVVSALVAQKSCSGIGQNLSSELLEDTRDGYSVCRVRKSPRHLVGAGDLDIKGIPSPDQHSRTLGDLVVLAMLDTHLEGHMIRLQIGQLQRIGIDQPSKRNQKSWHSKRVKQQNYTFDPCPLFTSQAWTIDFLNWARPLLRVLIPTLGNQDRWDTLDLDFLAARLNNKYQVQRSSGRSSECNGGFMGLVHPCTDPFPLHLTFLESPTLFALQDWHGGYSVDANNSKLAQVDVVLWTH